MMNVTIKEAIRNSGGKDGGLRLTFRHNLKDWHWTSIESPLTAGGIPDSEFCTPDGVQGWIEFKQTHAYSVSFKPLQVSWLMRRCRYGGNAWIAVRRRPHSKKEEGVDELWVMRGDQALALHQHGLEATSAWCWRGGDLNWDFTEVSKVLTNRL